MDIAALSTVSANVRLQQEVGVLMMRKVMDTEAQNSQGLQQILQSSVGQSLNPSVGTNIDISI